MEKTIISFPQLGIEDITLDPVAIRIGGLEIRWYGILILLGLLTAVFFGTRKMKKFNHTIDDVLDLLIVTVPSALVGCRLYYCAFNWGYYSKNPLKIITGITEGGLAFYGGLIGAVLAGLIVMKVKKMNIPAILDLYITQFPIAQAIGRWGNFINGEAYGGVTDLPWGMTIANEKNGVYATSVHPCFLYESLWNVVGFVLLYIHLDRRKFNGQNALLYLLWYGFGRFFIEGLRSDSLWIGGENEGLRVSRVLSAVMVVAAIVLLILIPILKKRRQAAMAVAGEGYESIVGASSLEQEPVDGQDRAVSFSEETDTANRMDTVQEVPDIADTPEETE